MFASKKRKIVFPQSEHGRFAGQVAAGWGNAQFARPPLDFDAFVAGVTLHDWQFGLMDRFPIGSIPEADWIEVTRQAIELEFDDPISEIVAKTHVRRLLTWRPSPQARALIEQLDHRIQQRLGDTNQTLEIFQLADTITCMLDFISFDFCFEQPKSRTSEVCADFQSRRKIRITVEIRDQGLIVVDPWPFSFPRQAGIVLGFKTQGYPDHPQPLVVPYEIRPRAWPPA